MGTHPIFESVFDCLTDIYQKEKKREKNIFGFYSLVRIMVKVIPNSKRELLTNSEVFQIVTKHQNEERERAKKSRKPAKADEALNTVTLETVNYLKKTPAAK